MDIDKIRKSHLAIAEALDAWRIIPRLVLFLYSYMLWEVINWYMKLEPYILPNCKSGNIVECIIQAPSTQHAVLISAVIGIAAAVFGLYSSTGKKWNGFVSWKSDKPTTLPKDDNDKPVKKETIE